MIGAVNRRCASLLIPIALLAFASSASAASRPTLSVLGIPNGIIAGKSMPYTETNSVVQLGVGYSGRLPAGTKLQLLVKVNSVTPYRATKTKVTLSGGHGKVHVTQGGLGGPYKYEIALVSGSRRLATSKPVTIYWTHPPGGIFALNGGGGSAYTSLTISSENCEPVGACKDDSGSGVQEFARAVSGTSPIPPGWSVTLIFNGQQMCTTTAINGECGVQITYPTVSAATNIPLTAEAASPKGVVKSATLLVTVYP
jgi:hypothetical protein